MNTEKYVNGEIIIADRMEDEEWYSDYQMLMEIGLLETNKKKIIKNFQKEYKIIHEKLFGDSKRLEMWASWIVESSKEWMESPEYKKLLELEKKNENRNECSW